MATTRLLTAADLWQMDDDGFRYELIEGELERMSPTFWEHGWIELEVGSVLRNYARPRGLGEVGGASTGFLLTHDPDTALSPDVSFIRADRLPPRGEWSRMNEIVPDLVVEILSTSERRGRIERKVRLYLAAGGRLIWLVDPRRRTVTVYAPDQEPRVLYETDELDGGDVLPGFRVSITSLFPPGGSQA